MACALKRCALLLLTVPLLLAAGCQSMSPEGRCAAEGRKKGTLSYDDCVAAKNAEAEHWRIMSKHEGGGR